MPDKTVHLHLSRQCNLKCAHCYTSSSPEYTRQLDSALVVEGLQVLRDNGYERLALSGGEPFLYRDLTLVLESAHYMGFKTSVISNGIVLSQKTVELIASYIDSVAISFDGSQDNLSLIHISEPTRPY